MSDDTPSAAATAINAVRQADTSEATTAPAATAADPRMDTYVRKERALQKQRQELEAERQSWKQKQAEYETGYVPKERLKSDPLSVLTEQGVTLDQLTDMLLNQPNQNDPATRAMLSKIKQLEDKQAAAERQAQEHSTRQYEQAKKQISTEAKLLVDSDPEFESIKAQDMSDAVAELIFDTFEQTGELMDVREAALEVENHLIEEGYSLAQLPKVKSRLNPPAAQASAPEPVTAKDPQKPQVSLRTLTNAVSETSAPKRLSEKERMARAMAAFRGELK